MNNCKKKAHEHGNSRMFGSSLQLAEPEAEAATFKQRHMVDSDSNPRIRRGARSATNKYDSIDVSKTL